MSNWPLLSASLSLTFHTRLQCGPWRQQTALLSILNFCSELQHLSLGSCVMVSIWKLFRISCLFSFYSHGWILSWLIPPCTHPQLFSLRVNYCVLHSQIFFLNQRVCLWNMDIIIRENKGWSTVWCREFDSASSQTLPQTSHLPVWVPYKYQSYPNASSWVSFSQSYF